MEAGRFLVSLVRCVINYKASKHAYRYCQHDRHYAKEHEKKCVYDEYDVTVGHSETFVILLCRFIVVINNVHLIKSSKYALSNGSECQEYKADPFNFLILSFLLI